MNGSDVYLLICKNFIGNFNILLPDLKVKLHITLRLSIFVWKWVLKRIISNYLI